MTDEMKSMKIFIWKRSGNHRRLLMFDLDLSAGFYVLSGFPLVYSFAKIGFEG